MAEGLLLQPGMGGRAELGLHVAPWTMNGMLLQVEGAGWACVWMARPG